MTWIVISALVVWLIYLQGRLAGLKERLDLTDRRLAALLRDAAPAPVAAPVPVKPVVVSSPPPEQPRPMPTAAPSSVVHAPPRPSRPPGKPFRETARAWLEENGLAWAGGAALALGGLFLVTYAAQRGVFTPAMRIAAAAATGLVLLGASEWLRRRAQRDERGHRLAAAVTAGAGAATLYGAVWASYWLYAFIGLPTAGAGLAVISLGLLALAFRHGEPLAILAIGGAFLAPVITGPQQWAAPALTAYLALITITGFVVAGGRRWGQAGLAALAGAALWAFAGLTAGGYVRVAALALAPVVLAYAAAEWRRRKGEAVELPVGGARPRDSFVLLPTAALCVGGLLLAVLWFPGSAAADPAAIGCIVLAGLAALGVRRGLFPPAFQIAAYVAATGGSLIPEATVWTSVLPVAAAFAGVASGAGRAERDALWGAVGAVAALLLCAALRGPLYVDRVWAPEAAAAVILFAWAAAVARRTERPTADLPLAVWIWSAGAAAVLALPQALDPRILPLGAAVLSLAVAMLHAKLGWRGLATVMTAAAIAALAALISPELFHALHEGRLRWFELAGVAAASTLLVATGGWFAGRGDRPRESAEALQTAALLLGLAGVFVLLRLWGTAGAVGGGTLDPFLESALRTVLILAAGLTSAMAVRADSSLIGRWRGQVLLLLGVAHGAAFQVFWANPLVAWWEPAVAGPPLADSLFVGYLAPAVLLAFATVRKASTNRPLLATYAAAAGGFGLVWAFMEVRRLFQGASLHAALDAIGRAEWAAYGLLAFAAAGSTLLLGWFAHRRTWTVASLAGALVAAGRGAGWVALVLALWIYGYAASAWWGPIHRPLAGHLAAGLLFGLYLAAAVAALGLARLAILCGDARLARAARLAAPAIVFALLSLLVRYAFRGLDMRPDLRDASLETWSFSAAWGLYGFGLLVYGVARRSADLRVAGLTVLMIALAKIFLFDMARLDGVIRAGSFLAVGALLLTAAVMVRRLSGSTGLALDLDFGRKRARLAEAPET